MEDISEIVRGKDCAKHVSAAQNATKMAETQVTIKKIRKYYRIALREYREAIVSLNCNYVSHLADDRDARLKEKYDRRW
jgi:hypothetical protein